MKPTGLPKYDHALVAMTEAETVDEAKAILDEALRREAYHHQAGDFELERLAKRIRWRAEREFGKFLRKTKESKTRQGRGGDRKSKSRQGTLIPALSDLGITNKQSFKFQRLAEVPEDIFESSMAAGTYEGLRAREIKRSNNEHPAWEEHWKDMPEFIQEDKAPQYSLLINFRSREDKIALGRLIGQPVTPKTRSITYPKDEIDYVARKRYVDASALSMDAEAAG